MDYQEIQKLAEQKGGKCLNGNNSLPTSYKIWWFQCKEGHVWKALPSSLKNKDWCPFCAKKKIWDSKTIHLEINEHLFEYIKERISNHLEFEIIDLLEKAIKG